MSPCASHGELLGGYVLNALEPSEMEEMRRHVASCRTCGPEARRLGVLPALLDTVEPAEVPPPTASPELEEAILDRFVRERPHIRAPRRWPRVAAVAAVIGVAAIALAIAVLPVGDGDDSGLYATARLAAVGAGSDASASASVRAVPAGTKVTLAARGLDSRGGAYEVWCVRVNGEWVSGGSFRASADGRAQAELTAAVKPGDYHVIVVTRADRSSDGAGRGTAVLRGELRY
jgi:Anti-sigma-K factor rskA/Putative zinc-finger